jgi:NADH dehydrogenase (ubiquinone) 1 alpha subcomplex subunit 5
MRSSTRLLATAARFLEPGTPTGLTGLFTHPAPRSTLIYLYSSTLDKLKALPKSSVYRQSTEALTKKRLKIVESIEPAGYREWQERVKRQLAEQAESSITSEGSVAQEGGRHVRSVYDNREFVATKLESEYDEREVEWDGETGSPVLEGTRTSAERSNQASLGRTTPGVDEKIVQLEAEPQLDADQYASPAHLVYSRHRLNHKLY